MVYGELKTIFILVQLAFIYVAPVTSLFNFLFKKYIQINLIKGIRNIINK